MSDNVMQMRYYVRQQREEINRLRRTLAHKKRTERAEPPPLEPLPQLGHGSVSRYRNGTCRCDDCRRAHREATAQRRLERLLSGDLTHGTRTAYDCGCRCIPCLDARRAAYQREKDKT